MQAFSELVFGRAYFVQSAREAAWIFDADDSPLVPDSVGLTQGGNSVVYFGETGPAANVSLNFEEIRVTHAGPVQSVFQLLAGPPSPGWKFWGPGLPDALLGFFDVIFAQAYWINVDGAEG